MSGMRTSLKFHYLRVQSHDLFIQMAHFRHLEAGKMHSFLKHLNHQLQYNCNEISYISNVHHRDTIEVETLSRNSSKYFGLTRTLCRWDQEYARAFKTLYLHGESLDGLSKITTVEFGLSFATGSEPSLLIILLMICYTVGWLIRIEVHIILYLFECSGFLLIGVPGFQHLLRSFQQAEE